MEFLSARDSIKSVGRAYSLVFGLLFALIVMTISMSAASERLSDIESGSAASTLYECGDSLKSYASAAREDERISASLRFMNAVARLECGERLTASLADYAGRLRYGNADYPDALTLSDEFFAIAAGDGDLTRLDHFFPPEDLSGSDAPEIPGRFVYSAVKGTAEALLDGVSGIPRPVRAGDEYIIPADNLRLTFSGADGAFRDMLFIRGGSEFTVSDEEILASAAKTAEILGIDKAELSLSGKLCGFHRVDVYGRRERFRFIYDGQGRLVAAHRIESEIA